MIKPVVCIIEGMNNESLKPNLLTTNVLAQLYAKQTRLLTKLTVKKNDIPSWYLFFSGVSSRVF